MGKTKFYIGNKNFAFDRILIFEHSMTGQMSKTNKKNNKFSQKQDFSCKKISFSFLHICDNIFYTI